MGGNASHHTFVYLLHTLASSITSISIRSRNTSCTSHSIHTFCTSTPAGCIIHENVLIYIVWEQIIAINKLLSITNFVLRYIQKCGMWWNLKKKSYIEYIFNATNLKILIRVLSFLDKWDHDFISCRYLVVKKYLNSFH